MHVSKSFLIILFSWAKEEVPGDVHLQAGAGDGEGLILPQSLVLIACEVRASNLLSQVSINLILGDFVLPWANLPKEKFSFYDLEGQQVCALWAWSGIDVLGSFWRGGRIETLGFVPFVCHKCPLLHPTCCRPKDVLDFNPAKICLFFCESSKKNYTRSPWATGYLV